MVFIGLVNVSSIPIIGRSGFTRQGAAIRQKSADSTLEAAPHSPPAEGSGTVSSIGIILMLPEGDRE
jgi:hypothetical protein